MSILDQLVANYAGGLQQSTQIAMNRLNQPTAADLFLQNLRKKQQMDLDNEKLALAQQEAAQQAAYQNDQIQTNRAKALSDFMGMNKAGMMTEEEALPVLQGMPWLKPEQVASLAKSAGNNLALRKQQEERRKIESETRNENLGEKTITERAMREPRVAGAVATARLTGSKADISEINEVTQDELRRAQISKLNYRPPVAPAAMRMAAYGFNQLPQGAQIMIDQLARAVANGDLGALENARTSPYASQVFQRITEIKPDFQYDPNAVKNKAAEQKFWVGGGAGAKQIADTNTAAHHLAKMAQLTMALENKDMRALNVVRNLYKTQTGQEAPTNFDFAAQFIGNEVIKASKGSGVLNAQEQEHFDKNVSTAASPRQLIGHIHTALQLMGGRLAANEQRYQEAYGQSISKRLTPQAKQAFAAVGIDFHTPEDLGSMPFGDAPQYKPQVQQVAPQANPASQVPTTVRDGKTYYKWSDGKWHTKKPGGM